MNIMRQLCIAALALAGLSLSAHADDLRACSQDELNKATVAPMPKDLKSLSDFWSHSVWLAGYVIRIDATGHPELVCAMDSFTQPELREIGAEAVRKFVYWPADVTLAGKLAYVHIQSQASGMSIPSVLPRATDPVCDPSMIVPPGWIAFPIFKQAPIYQSTNYNKGKVVDAVILVRVTDTGATQLFCTVAGKNVDSFAGSIYYAVAAWRFEPKPGRTPFTYTINIKFRMGGG